MEDDDALARAGRFFVDAFWYVIVSSSVSYGTVFFIPTLSLSAGMVICYLIVAFSQKLQHIITQDW